MIRLRRSSLRLFDIRTRMPFRYGIAELTETPHLFCELELAVGNRRALGIAADSLVPKWFTKDPAQTYEQEIEAMLAVIGKAVEHAEQAGSAPDLFTLWRRTFAAQKAWAASTPHPPLLWNFGVSLVERAMIDAYCRATETTLHEAIRNNRLGIELGWIHPQLIGRAPREFLPEKPGSTLFLRHTVGLSDPLAEPDLPARERLHDGLPQTLEASIEAYGLRYFKIKVNGDDERDLARLTRIAAIIEAATDDYAFTLDGNEQYHSVATFRAFWQRLAGTPELAEFMAHLLFVEQPLHRAVALSDETQAQLLAWDARPPLIIDESDAELHSLRRALACGYAGASHKNCKGVFKGIANACLLAHLRQTQPGRQFVLSGEDLANVGPVALLQDLAVMAALGLTHVERNGHHYFAGLSMFPESVRNVTLAAHPDLYHISDRGLTALEIDAGMISLTSIVQAPFGVGASLDLSFSTPVQDWHPAALAPAI